MSKMKELERLRRAIQQTTLIESNLYNCHFHLYTKLRLYKRQPNTAEEVATSTIGKRIYCPRLLRPWDAFSTVQHQRHFNKIQGVCGEARRFDNEQITRNKGIELENWPAGSEECISYFEGNAVKCPVLDILSVLQKDRSSRRQFQFSQLYFARCSGGIERSSQNTTEYEESQLSKQREIPNGFGIRKGLDGTENLAFVYLYEAAHRFSPKYLEDILKNERLFIEVAQRVVSGGYSLDEELRNQQEEEERIAMAVAQAFHSMISYGVGYGFIAAGRCMVLLHLDPTKPQTLYYHLCIPGEDVPAGSSGNRATQVSYTAVAKLASFCLLSLRSKALVGNAHRKSLRQAKRVLKIWGECYDDMEQQSKSKDVDEEARQGQGGDFGDAHTHIEPPEQYGEDQDASLWGVHRQYCTQACLLSLKRGGNLDEKCPNFTSHRAITGSTRHPINAGEFTRIVRDQLRHDPYQHCVPLHNEGKYGAIGVLFKLELAPYGYTFVGKGTWPDLVRRLEHETRVYERLDKLQGDVVPVHLGMVHFDPGYFLPLDMVHDMMLMSWGGEEVEEEDEDSPGAVASLEAVRAAGVFHDDERCHNMLWNAERNGVMIIDFDRSQVSGEE